MKLPSVQQIADDALRALRRFPFVLALAAAGTAAAIVAVEYESTRPPDWTLRVLYAALAGAGLLIGLRLTGEKRRWSASTAAAAQSVAVLLLVFYAWSLPGQLAVAPEIHLVRLLLLMTGAVLFAAVAPWIGRGSVTGFWQYNKTLLLRMVTAFLFTVVLYAGLAIALAAVENLFELSVPGERYMQLWILLIGMVMTWFFLAGVPADLDALDAEDDYPRGLKIFAQYVLMPLVAVYLLILIAYSGKIILAWSWPYGWVSRLILGFAGTGLFTILLLHPLRTRADGRWIITATRGFHLALAPLLVMYFLAVLERLSDYGLTELRYLAIVLGAWLAAMVLYFLLSRGKDIRIIPLSLCILAFAVSAGPWSAFSVAEHSQVGRLRAMLERNGILADGRVQEATGDVSVDDAREISAVLRYLREVHGYGAIAPWFERSLREERADAWSLWKDASDVADMMGVAFVEAPRVAPGDALVYEIDPEAVMIVEGYQRVLPPQIFAYRLEERTFRAGAASFSLNPALDTLTFVYTPGDNGDPAEAGDRRPDRGEDGAGAETGERNDPGDGKFATGEGIAERDGASSQPPAAGGPASAASGMTPDTVIVPLRPVTDTLRAVYDDAGAGGVPLELTAAEAGSPRTRVKVYVTRLQLRREDDALRTIMITVRVLYGARE